jgi:hypothetical protein
MGNRDLEFALRTHISDFEGYLQTKNLFVQTPELLFEITQLNGHNLHLTISYGEHSSSEVYKAGDFGYGRGKKLKIAVMSELTSRKFGLTKK